MGPKFLEDIPIVKPNTKPHISMYVKEMGVVMYMGAFAQPWGPSWSMTIYDTEKGMAMYDKKAPAEDAKESEGAY